MHLTEANDSLVTNSEEVAKQLNHFFVNAINSLNIPSYENFDFLAENINDPTVRAIVKEVLYNCSAHSSAHLFIIEKGSYNHIKLKQPQKFFL